MPMKCTFPNPNGVYWKCPFPILFRIASNGIAFKLHDIASYIRAASHNRETIGFDDPCVYLDTFYSYDDAVSISAQMVYSSRSGDSDLTDQISVLAMEGLHIKWVDLFLKWYLKHIFMRWVNFCTRRGKRSVVNVLRTTVARLKPGQNLDSAISQFFTKHKDYIRVIVANVISAIPAGIAQLGSHAHLIQENVSIDIVEFCTRLPILHRVYRIIDLAPAQESRIFSAIFRYLLAQAFIFNQWHGHRNKLPAENFIDKNIALDLMQVDTVDTFAERRVYSRLFMCISVILSLQLWLRYSVDTISVSPIGSTAACSWSWSKLSQWKRGNGRRKW